MSNFVETGIFKAKIQKYDVIMIRLKYTPTAP